LFRTVFGAQVRDQLLALEVTETSQVLGKAERIFSSAGEAEGLPDELKAFARQRLQSVREYRRKADALAREQAGVRP
jgi:hypothetical protein